MNNLHQAKVKRLATFFKRALNDSPFTAQYHGAFWNYERLASYVIDLLREEEMKEEERFNELNCINQYQDKQVDEWLESQTNASH